MGELIGRRRALVAGAGALAALVPGLASAAKRRPTPVPPVPRVRSYQVSPGFIVVFDVPAAARSLPASLEVEVWSADQQTGEPARVTLDGTGRPSGMDLSLPVRERHDAEGHPVRVTARAVGLLQLGADRRAVLRSVGVTGRVTVRV